ncbi:MAG: peptidylprolyl isomerase [Planctomycetaceae bacterium]|jgi:parvulin-like peptidyl-prolyl isomerase|nr:peptidylprolyl isomerase [Planctomycetaceae bacterium]MBT6848964.1 peptidylprolyl isomerase [Planctomycetaceae bacterium]
MISHFHNWMRLHNCQFSCLGFIVCVLLQTPAGAIVVAPTATDTERKVAATVNGKPIYVSAIDTQIELLIPNLDRQSARYQKLRNDLLAKTIDRHLALEYLHHSKIAASNDDIQLAIIRLEKRLKLKQQSLDDYLREQDISHAELSHRIDWQISWNRYLNKYVSDANLQKYFTTHKSQFDGTTSEIYQILLTSHPTDPVKQKATLDQARQIIRDVRSDAISFSAAAKKYSISPTGKTGGLVGSIKYRGSMPLHFSNIAFSLEVGEVSIPFESEFGIHILRCNSIKVGTRTWQQARPQLREALVESFFSFLVNTRRKMLKAENKLEKHIEINSGWQ